MTALKSFDMVPAPDVHNDVRYLRDAMCMLKSMIAGIAGPNDGIDLCLAKDMTSFDLTIYLKLDQPGDELRFTLKHSPLSGVAFKNIEERPVNARSHRKMVVAKIVHPSEL